MRRKRILLAVTGLSPQVVTEALYALAVLREPAWPADEVHLITTLKGAENARRLLMGPNTRWLYRLCEDWGLTPPRLDDSTIHAIRDAYGRPLDDIRTDADNASAADQILAVVRALTDREDTEICASLAGGRKTMGYLLGASMALCGRPQDTLCHVLVSPPFESHPEFFYPTPYSRVITALDRTAQAIDCRDAQVWLGDIPFIRLRGWVPPRSQQPGASFAQVVRAAADALCRQTPPTLVLRPDGAMVGDRPLALTARQHALLVLLAAHTVRGRGLRSPLRGVADDAQWRQQALQLVSDVWGPQAAELPALQRWLLKPQPDLASGFDQQLSRLRRAMRDLLGRDLVDERAPGAVANRRSYRLAVPPGCLQWQPLPLGLRTSPVRRRNVHAMPLSAA